jgi:hypothetical protein
MTGNATHYTARMCTIQIEKVMSEDKDANTICTVLAFSRLRRLPCAVQKSTGICSATQRDDSLTGEKQMTDNADHKATVAAASARRG